MQLIRKAAEGLARATSRRRFLGNGAQLAFGALAGAAAGQIARPDRAAAGVGTVCFFPGPPCACDQCQTSGVCAKPCLIYTLYYASGCWVTQTGNGPVTCCDCDCQGNQGFDICGCGSDYHNNPSFCPP